MKKILILSLMFLSLQAKTQINDLIKKDGSSYKSDGGSYKEDGGSYKEDKDIYNGQKLKQKKTPIKIKKEPVKIKKEPVKIKKEPVKIKRTKISHIKKVKVKPVVEKKKDQNIDKITPKREIKELLNLDSNDVSVTKVEDIKTKKKLYLSDEYIDSIKNTILSSWNKTVFHTGQIKTRFIINTTTGKIEKIFIIERKGSTDFSIDFKVFLDNISKKRLMRIKTKNGLIELEMILKKQIEERSSFNKISILKNKRSKVYKEYMEYLVSNKGYSLSQIKEILNSPKNTVTKNMLYAIYADYTKNNTKEAKKHYDIVIENKIKRFIKSSEGLYLADYALREGKDSLVLKILPRFSCQFMDEPEQNYCYYYRARALYRLGKDYEIPLNIVKYKLKEAKIFYKDIKKEKINKKVKRGRKWKR